MLGRKARPQKGGRRPQPDDASADPMPEERRVAAWVGRSMVIKGDLTSSEDLTIAGRVEGDVAVRDHSLIVGPHANIRANIVAKVVRVHGTVTGTIRASEKIEVEHTGSVEGDLLAPRVAVADGAMLQGRIGIQASVAVG